LALCSLTVQKLLASVVAVNCGRDNEIF